MAVRREGCLFSFHSKPMYLLIVDLGRIVSPHAQWMKTRCRRLLCRLHLVFPYNDEVRGEVLMGFFLWFVNGSSAGQFPQYVCPVSNSNFLPTPSRAVQRISFVWNPRLCRCSSLRFEDSMDSGFDESVIHRKMLLKPAEYIQIDVIPPMNSVVVKVFRQLAWSLYV